MRTTRLHPQVLESEFRARGIELERWATDRGVSPRQLFGMVEGSQPPNEALLWDLADTLGVSLSSLRAA